MQASEAGPAASASGCLDSLRPMELYVLVRHGESTLNSENRINGNPDVPVALTEKGRDEARLLGQQIAHIRLDVCICTRFTRTRETAEIALQGRDVPIEIEPLLDDINVGHLDGIPLEEYRAWKREHTRRDPFPGGESLNAAARRYAQALRKLLGRIETSVLVVAHEIPVRYAINAADGSDDLDGPAHQLANATPYLFDKEALAHAVEGIERLA
jgi:broad specificity phosphatase PhoE